MGIVKKCHSCDGKGYTPYTYQIDYDDWEMDFDPCDTCRSKGQFNLLLCLLETVTKGWDVEHIWRGIPYKSYYDIW